MLSQRTQIQCLLYLVDLTYIVNTSNTNGQYMLSQRTQIQRLLYLVDLTYIVNISITNGQYMLSQRTQIQRLLYLVDVIYIVNTSITDSHYMLSQKANKFPKDKIHRPNVTSLWKIKNTASVNNPQIQLNRNNLLISGTHTTFHDIISYNFNVLYIIIELFHQPTLMHNLCIKVG